MLVGSCREQEEADDAARLTKMQEVVDGKLRKKKKDGTDMDFDDSDEDNEENRAGKSLRAKEARRKRKLGKMDPMDALGESLLRPSRSPFLFDALLTFSL